jgi:hypothetical protein
MRTPALILGLGLLLTGCQTSQSIEKHAGFDNVGFMNLWDRYRHCENVSDLEAMQVDARHLNHIAHQPIVLQGSEIPLPKAIQRLVAEPPSRLAVDPKAMAAACSLHVGQVALTVGRDEVAYEMFRTVLKYPTGASPYYIEQAQAGLAQVSIGSLAALEPSSRAFAALTSRATEK